MMKRFLVILCFTANVSISQADQLRLSAGYTAVGSYFIENVETQYSVTGFRAGVDYFFGESVNEFSMDLGLDTILGFGVHYEATDMEIDSGATVFTDNNFKTTTYSLRALPGLSYSGWRLEVPIGMNWLTESSVSNDGDSKYGWGVGLQIHYPVYGNWHLGAAYETVFYNSGKNNSTGQSGSLANDVVVTSGSVIVSYLWGWSSYSYR